MRSGFYSLLTFLVSSTGLLVLNAQQHRPPAVPLIANDPSFSVWSMADNLTDAPTKHWSEALQPMSGFVRIDGQVYRWMGTSARGFRMPETMPMRQDSVEVTPLHSRYRFSAGVFSCA